MHLTCWVFGYFEFEGFWALVLVYGFGIWVLVLAFACSFGEGLVFPIAL